MGSLFFYVLLLYTEGITNGSYMNPGEVPLRGFVHQDIAYTQSVKPDINDPYKEVIRVFLWKSEDNVKAMQQCLKENAKRQIRDNIANPSESMREGLSLPVGLMRALEKHDPELFSNTPQGKRKRDMFRKRYPVFTVYKH